ncbi:MAG: hypothetical protein AAB487_02160 [Patescibacteria group bacterium]
MHKNRKIKTWFLVVASLAFGWALSAGLASAAEGLSIDVQVKDLVTQAEKDEIAAALPVVKWPEWHGESVYKVKGNIDYYTTSNNLRNNFPLIARTSGYLYPLELRAKGAIYISKTGTYDFDWDYTGNAGVTLEIKEKDGTTVKCDSNPNTGEGSCLSSPNFTAVGWYPIYFDYKIDESIAWNTDPQIRLTWDTPDIGGFNVIPASAFDSSNWDVTEISIPSSGKQQIDYKVAGVGTDVAAKGGGVEELEIQLPVGITAGDILPGGVQLFWRNSASTTLKVKNAATTDATINLTGTRLSTAKGVTLEGITKKLPDNFFANSAGDSRVYLSFQGLDADVNGDTWPDFDGGIALVVVYKDLTKPSGVLNIRTLGEEVYRSASHSISFDVSTMDPTTLRPFFLLEDGMSKASLASEARHNYLAMKASASQPSESELFIKGRVMTAAQEIDINNPVNPGAKRIIPRSNGASDPAGPVDRWYPEYGREGAEIDVLSTAQNYAPNLRYGDYVSGNSDGVFDTVSAPFQIPAGNNWVSFQYASSDFAGDGSAPLHSNESSFFFATGLLYYDAAKLVICPANATLGLGETKPLEARYWATYFGIPDCNTTGWTNVTNTATWSSSDSGKVSLPAKGSIKGEATTTTPVNISAVYSSITAAMEVTVNDTSCVSYSCVSSTCVANPGTSPCPPNSGGCTTSGGTCNSGSNTNVRWEEVAP